MTDRELTHFYGITAILLAVAISLFQSQRVRSWCFITFTSWRSTKKGKFNAYIQARIDLISELAASPARAQAYYFAKAFMVLIVFFAVFFFSIILLLRVNIIVSAIDFFVFWAWLLILTSEPFDVAVKLRNPEKAIEWLEGQKKP
jgi:hypothetical protein